MESNYFPPQFPPSLAPPNSTSDPVDNICGVCDGKIDRCPEERENGGDSFVNLNLEEFNHLADYFFQEDNVDDEESDLGVGSVFPKLSYTLITSPSCYPPEGKKVGAQKQSVCCLPCYEAIKQLQNLHQSLTNIKLQIVEQVQSIKDKHYCNLRDHRKNNKDNKPYITARPSTNHGLFWRKRKKQCSGEKVCGSSTGKTNVVECLNFLKMLCEGGKPKGGYNLQKRTTVTSSSVSCPGTPAPSFTAHQFTSSASLPSALNNPSCNGNRRDNFNGQLGPEYNQDPLNCHGDSSSTACSPLENEQVIASPYNNGEYTHPQSPQDNFYCEMKMETVETTSEDDDDDDEIGVASPSFSSSLKRSLSPKPPPSSANGSVACPSTSPPPARIIILKTSGKSYKCSVCEKVFAKKNVLAIHLRTHNGDRPYQCHLCPSRFAQGGALKKHYVTHTGERPFQCQICGNRYTQAGALSRHTRTHQ